MENDITKTPPVHCPICQSEIRHVPGGISKKTNKPYSEFWSCENKECDFTWNKPKPGNSQNRGWEKEQDQGEKIIGMLTTLLTEFQKMSECLDRLEKYSVIYPQGGKNDEKDMGTTIR